MGIKYVPYDVNEEGDDFDNEYASPGRKTNALYEYYEVDDDGKKRKYKVKEIDVDFAHIRDVVTKAMQLPYAPKVSRVEMVFLQLESRCFLNSPTLSLSPWLLPLVVGSPSLVF